MEKLACEKMPTRIALRKMHMKPTYRRTAKIKSDNTEW